MKMNKRRIRMISYGGLLTGLVLVATMFLHIPNGFGGNLNLGDGVIFASAMILGPFAGIIAALGSVLADLFSGYGQYAPATLVIKGLMGLVAGLMLRTGKIDKYLYTAFVFMICELIMIAGYFAFESVLFGLTVSLPSILPNIIQAVAGIAIGLASVPMVKRIFESEKFSI
jgi:uncharacterized membrane protein